MAVLLLNKGDYVFGKRLTLIYWLVMVHII